jgi:hypothetical protein
VSTSPRATASWLAAITPSSYVPHVVLQLHAVGHRRGDLLDRGRNLAPPHLLTRFEIIPWRLLGSPWLDPKEGYF